MKEKERMAFCLLGMLWGSVGMAAFLRNDMLLFGAGMILFAVAYYILATEELIFDGE